MRSRSEKRTFTSLKVELLERRDLPSTYFVATTGSDSGGGTSQAPWLTLQHAVDTVKPGDVIEVESGTYVGCRIGNSGTATAPCTLEAAPGASVVINAPGPSNDHGSDIEVENFSAVVSYWVIQGMTVVNAPSNAGIDIRNTNYITVEDCTCTGNYNWGIFLAFSNHPLIASNNCSNNLNQHGIYDSNSGDYPTIIGNVCDNNPDCGIELNGDKSQGGDGIITGALIAGNTLEGNGALGGAGINCDGVQSSVIENNLIANELATGIVLYKADGGGGSTNNVVVNNTVVLAATDTRAAVSITNNSTGNTLYNNILLAGISTGTAISVDSKSRTGLVSNYNILSGKVNGLSLTSWQSKYAQDKNSVTSTSSALFVNAAAGDYHLNATSLAIDKGTATDAPTTDLDGNLRAWGSGYDIGCYEWQGYII